MEYEEGRWWIWALSKGWSCLLLAQRVNIDQNGLIVWSTQWKVAFPNTIVKAGMFHFPYYFKLPVRISWRFTFQIRDPSRSFVIDIGKSLYILWSFFQSGSVLHTVSTNVYPTPLPSSFAITEGGCDSIYTRLIAAIDHIYLIEPSFLYTDTVLLTVNSSNLPSAHGLLNAR